METSCATISPDARGAATAGGPEFGKRARRKSPRRSANRFLLKRALRKAEIPSLPRHLPYARALIVSHRGCVCTWSNETGRETLPRGVGRVSYESKSTSERLVLTASKARSSAKRVIRARDRLS